MHTCNNAHTLPVIDCCMLLCHFLFSVGFINPQTATSNCEHILPDLNTVAVETVEIQFGSKLGQIWS